MRPRHLDRYPWQSELQLSWLFPFHFGGYVVGDLSFCQSLIQRLLDHVGTFTGRRRGLIVHLESCGKVTEDDAPAQHTNNNGYER